MNNPIQSRSRRSLLRTSVHLVGATTLASIYSPALLAQSAKPIKIGCTHDLTGALSMDGTWNDLAVKAAVKWVNTHGGVGGRPIELYTEDTETNTQTALRKFRSLVLSNEVDFVVGATHSGHNIASAPVAKELKTPYFASGTALETTTTKGNRWIFRGVNNIRQQMKAMALVTMKELKPRYYFIGADYAWGRSLVKETKTYVSEQGGQIIGESFIPLGTPDFAPYLNNLDPNSFDTLVVGMTGGDAVRFLRQAYSLGILNSITVVGNIAVTSGSTVSDLGPGAKGSWYTTMYPRRSIDVPDSLRAFDEAYRAAMGVDAESKEISTGRVANLPYSFVAWQAIFQIKNAIEQSGWGSRADHPKFIQAMEGLTGRGSLEYPQGDFHFRPEDHQIVHRQYIETIRDEQLQVVTYIEPDQLGYPPEVDYRTEAL